MASSSNPAPSPATNPGVAIAQAMRGKRTGVALGKKGDIPASQSDGMEDVDQFWQSAKTPVDDAKRKPTAKKQPLKASNRKESPAKRNIKPRLSLPGVNGTAEEGGGEEETTQHFLSHLEQTQERSLSPSDMSRVSTAPPSPVPETPAAEDIPVSPEDVRASVQEPEEQVALSHAHKHDDSPSFPTADDDDDVMQDGFPEDDEMVPPPPADDDDDKEDQQDDGNLVTASQPVPDTQEEEVDFPTNVDDHMEDGDDDDMDKSGKGFSMTEDAETPESVREELARLERKKNKAKRKKRESTSSKDDETATPAPKKRAKKKKNVTYSSPLGYPAGNREYQAVPVSDYKESPEDDTVRRSRRARYPPLSFWKNERPVFAPHDEDGELGEAMGCMPVVSGVLTALPTPYKKRNVTHLHRKKAGGKATSRSASKEPHQVEQNPFDSSKLRKKYDIINGEDAEMWDETKEKETTLKVVSYADSMVYSELPISAQRKKSEGKVAGRASQAFNVPSDDKFVGYISGNLVLPPRGIKDPESSGVCSLVFTVHDAQPGAVELALGDPEEANGQIDTKTAQRFLLGPGDMFRVPPGNSYRLQNHSKSTTCSVSWIIVRPKEVEPQSPASSTS